MRDIILREGFAFVEADVMRGMLEKVGGLSDWPAFAASWNDLAIDTYMADRGRYRKRRYGVYHIDAYGVVTRAAHQPHYQTLDYNHLNGGLERWFEPILPEIGESESFTTLLHFCHQLFSACAPNVQSWHIEAHQFRIEARPHEKGKPTPEGMHRDGVDYVLVLMMCRENIASGVTTIHDLDHKQVGNFTLIQPFDAALVDDQRVFHGVTAVTPLDPEKPAYRDVLVITFRRQ